MFDFGILLIIFGGIFLGINIVAGILMKKNITNPDCSEDVNSVLTNKKFQKNGTIISAIVIIIGLLCILL